MPIKLFLLIDNATAMELDKFSPTVTLEAVKIASESLSLSQQRPSILVC
jgi:hypothetical protein